MAVASFATPLEMLNALLDPSQTILAADREQWERIVLASGISKRHTTPKRLTSAYNHAHVADTCRNVPPLIRALHKMASIGQLPDCLAMQVHQNNMGNDVLAAYFNPVHAQHLELCSMSEFAPSGSRTLQGIGLITVQTSAGRAVNLHLILQTPQPFVDELTHKYTQEKDLYVDSHFGITVSPIGNIESYVSSTHYVRGSSIPNAMNITTPQLTERFSGILQRDDWRTGCGSIGTFCAEQLPAITAYVEHVTRNIANHPSIEDTEEDIW